MKKIAFHLNCLEQGGAERVVTNLANQFAAEGYEVTIATEWIGENEFSIDPRVRRIVVGLQPEDERRGRVDKFFRRVRYLRDFMKRERPDVLIAFAQRANYRALMAAPGTGVPVVISIRTDPVGHYDAVSDKIQIPLLFPRAAGCVFQTTGQREFFKPYLQENSTIILNPVNPKYLGVPAPAQREKSVVQSARLVDFKNQPMLLRAFAMVHEKHPDYVLKIYGGDSGDGTKEILEGMIQEWKAQDWIFLMGASDSLEQELIRGSVYAFSSDWEGMPNALLEAMALGMPIVATDCPCGGPRTVMTDEVNGLLVPIKDPEAMAAGICRLIEDRELAERLGAEARKLERIANPEAVFGQWKDYLEQVTK
ncbi:MAG: glycosyltransferase [Eubacteriales bacterium]|nr:glycosyltransferase [Eubacteriales bacterium]